VGARGKHLPAPCGGVPGVGAASPPPHPRPGDVFALNDPYSGGTHLPDITLVSTVAPEGEILGYAVTRAHHSDVGGMSPGSMPAVSREIHQEGLVIPPVRLVRNGEYVQEILDLILANVRTPAIRRGDLQAQVAANQLAERRISELIDRRGRQTVLDAFEDVISYTEQRTREVIRDLPNGEYRAEDVLEGDGITEEDIPIRVTVRIEEESMIVDFSGTAGATAGNVNCPLAVTRSACYFALRVLLSGDVPANAGTYAPLSIETPESSLVNASYPSAVVAGNVETSSRIADTVMLALSQIASLPAQGQGTMNVVTMGNSAWTYVETIGGGQGASERGNGPSGVHVGMSNTLNTPIEAFELEYPMRVESYELLYGSGGIGEHLGGDGIVRSIRVLEPASLSLLTDRRRHAPRGGGSGESGKPGKNLLNGEDLPAKTFKALEPGDLITIHTPGGGGWGLA
ncbi:MAG: hydantoinase B/oxoprolinase family protein, partial [Rubrobacteraceae bacterium]